MSKYLYLIIIAFISSNSLKAQNVADELGGSINISLMNSDFGLIPGAGFKFDNRINFAGSNLVIKNSLGLTTYAKMNIEGTQNKALDYLWMFDAMLEYNWFSFGDIQYKSKTWTPYIGAGINAIYRSTKAYGSRAASSGFYTTLKGSLGAKFKLNKYTTLTAEGYLEWDFSDGLDSYVNNPDKWWRYDHTANFSIGITYLLHSKSKNKRLPWSDNL